MVARSLYGKIVEEVFYVLKGNGRNGKGSEDTLIRNAFGNYYYYLDNKNLTTKCVRADVPNSQIFNCFGKRYISSSETAEDDEFNGTTFKNMSGNDPFSIRTLHGKPITFVFTGYLNVQTNDDIKFDKFDFATAKRTKVQEYPFSFVEDYAEVESDEDEGGFAAKKIDTSLKAKFMTEEYRDQFLLMLFDLFQNDLYEDFSIDQPAEVLSFTKKNLSRSIAAAKWFNKYYEITDKPDHRVPKTELYEEYEKEVGKDYAIKKQKFYADLLMIGVKEIKTGGIRCFTGIKKQKMWNLIDSLNQEVKVTC